MTLYEPPAEEPRGAGSPDPSFSLPLALLHAVLIAGAVFCLGLGLFAVGFDLGPARSAEPAGRFAAVAALLALLWSTGTQLEKPSLSAVGGLGVLALTAALLATPFLPWARFSDRERAVPFTLDDGRLCQPALDVVVPRPSAGYRLQEEPAVSFGRRRQVQSWTYGGPVGRTMSLIVSKVGGDGKEDFTRFARGLEDALIGDVVSRRLTWRSGAGEYRYAWTTEDGDAGDVVCRSSGPRDGQRPLVACVVTFADSHAALAPVRRGLAFADCGGSS